MEEKSLDTLIRLRVDSALKERFEEAAKKRGDSSKILRELIEAYLRRCQRTPLPELPLTVTGADDK